MKYLKLLIMIILLTNFLFAKTHEGTFKFMDLRKEKNSFDTNIEVKYSVDTLMGEPLIKAKARYEILGLVNINGKRLDLSKKQLNKLKINDLKIRVPFETNSVNKLLWIEIDMGAMGKHGKWSYNTPSSPNWNKWIISEGGYLSKKEAIKAYKGFQRLGMNDSLGSLATAVNIKFHVLEVKEKGKNKKVLRDIWIDKKTGLMWQDENYSQREIDNYMKYYKKGKNIGKTGNWNYSKKYCQKLILNGFRNWRLPSIAELDGIKDKRKNFKSIKQFRGVWSSSKSGDKKYIYSFVDYDKGDKSRWIKNILTIEFIRCVRNVK